MEIQWNAIGEGIIELIGFGFKFAIVHGIYTFGKQYPKTENWNPLLLLLKSALICALIAGFGVSQMGKETECDEDPLYGTCSTVATHYVSEAEQTKSFTIIFLSLFIPFLYGVADGDIPSTNSSLSVSKKK